MSGYVNNAANELNNVRLNASIDSVITGDGSHSSDTLIGGGKGAAGGIDHEHSDSGHSTTIWGGSAAGAGASHEGNASGTVTGSTQIVAAPDLGGLTSSINGLSSQVTMLNNAASGTVGTLANDIRSINNKFNELTGTLFSAISSLSGGTGDIIVDTSDVDIDSVTFGKVSSCRNSGAVYGDVNTGGITGSMTIEYTLDPEDDVTGHLSNIYRKQYEYRSIIQKCVNTGDVAGKQRGRHVGRMARRARRAGCSDPYHRSARPPPQAQSAQTRRSAGAQRERRLAGRADRPRRGRQSFSRPPPQRKARRRIHSRADRPRQRTKPLPRRVPPRLQRSKMPLRRMRLCPLNLRQSPPPWQ